jgi:hypothetical protein
MFPLIHHYCAAVPSIWFQSVSASTEAHDAALWNTWKGTVHKDSSVKQPHCRTVLVPRPIICITHAFVNGHAFYMFPVILHCFFLLFNLNWMEVLDWYDVPISSERDFQSYNCHMLSTANWRGIYDKEKLERSYLGHYQAVSSSDQRLLWRKKEGR